MDNIYNKTRTFWNKKPCGSGLSNYPIGSYEFFQDFDKKFKSMYPYFDEILDVAQYKGKKVLLIGLGSGYELGQIAQVTDQLVALDLSNETVELANKRKKQFNLNFQTVCASATSMPFEKNSFDAIVSIGCLHHIPDIDSVVNELNRVLVKGGSISIMLYYQYSVRALFGIYLKRFMHNEYKGLNYEDSIAIAYDGIGNPYARLYSKKDVKNIFKGFKNFDFKIENFDSSDLFPKIGSFIPRNFYLKTIGKIMGLDLYFKAVKE